VSNSEEIRWKKTFESFSPSTVLKPTMSYHPLGFYVSLPAFSSESDSDAFKSFEDDVTIKNELSQLEDDLHLLKGFPEITDQDLEIKGDVVDAKEAISMPEIVKKKKTDVKKYVCDRCSHSFRLKSTLVQHLMKHLTTKNFRCVDCHRNYWDEAFFKKHRLNHAKIPPLKCVACLKYYTDIHGFENHVLRFHTKTGSFPCKKCNFTTRSYHGLFNHKLYHVNIEKGFTCERCHQTFTTKMQYDYHQKVYADNKKYECTICCKRFTSFTHKHSHMREAHGETAFIRQFSI
jgi:hypothetical protein